MKHLRSVTVLLVTLILISATAVQLQNTGEAVFIPSDKDHSRSVAVLVQASHFQDGSDHADDHYYRMALATYQALVYLGISAEIVASGISSENLNEYGGLITIKGEGSCWRLAKNYAETTGRDVLWIYVDNGDRMMNKELGIIDRGRVTSSDAGLSATIATDTSITTGLSDEYGSLSTYATRPLKLDSRRSTWTIYAQNADHPFLFRAEQKGATYYVYATSTSHLEASENAGYYLQLVLNYAGIAMPNLIRWMPIPSAKDSGLIIRADDAAQNDPAWVAFWARYPHSTSAIQARISPEAANYVRENCDDYLPHGYSHEDFTTLNYTGQVKLLQKINSAWEERFGERPYYYIMPFNSANEDTTKAISDTGGLFFTSVAEWTGYPSTYFPGGVNDMAVTWGAYQDGEELEDYVNMIIDQGRSVGSIVFHPYHENWTGSIVPRGDYVIDRVLNDRTVMLTTLSEIADLYFVRQSISVDDDSIHFSEDTPSGLTLEYRGMPEGKTLRVGDIVLPRLGDRLVFPAMTAGVYPYELVDIDDCPVVISVSAGMALKDGSYNMTAGETNICLEGWNPDGIVTANLTFSTQLNGIIIDGEGQQVIISGSSVILTPGTYRIVIF